MPEGHTLHRLAHQMETLFIGLPWRVTSPQGRFEAGARRLNGRTPELAEAWGKHLFIHLGSDIWRVHLGLYGAFSFHGSRGFAAIPSLGAPRTAQEPEEIRRDRHGWVVPAAPRGAVRARVRSRDGWADLRGPATCAVISAEDHDQILRTLGPDPLRQPGSGVESVALEQFCARLGRRRTSIAAALMDQSVIAGVGNIYRAEALFAERIDPALAARDLCAERTAALWLRLTSQLRDGVVEGTIRTFRPEDPQTHQLADPLPGHRRHWVYRHHGTPCLRCSETIASRQVQGRTLFWCPGCQS